MYFQSILILSFISAGISLIYPEEKKFGKYVRYTVSLAMLLTVISPIFNIDITALTIPEIHTEYETADPRDIILSEMKSSLRADISSELFTKFRVSDDYAEVKVTLSDKSYDDIKIESVIITLKSYGAWADSTAIADYFSDKYKTKVEVVYE